jgi:hypothetical protein
MKANTIGLRASAPAPDVETGGARTSKHGGKKRRGKSTTMAAHGRMIDILAIGSVICLLDTL